MSNEYIEIKNLRENNLKGINLLVPKHKITIFTGVSGSGKSSIVFDTIGQEAGRLLNETYPSYARMFLPKHTIPLADKIDNISPAIVIDQKKIGGNPRSTLGTVSEINNVFRVLFSRFGDNRLPLMNHYSFNDPHGMCPKCGGIGKIITLDVHKAIDFNLSLNEGAILLPGHKKGSYPWKIYGDSGFFDNDKKIKDYNEEELELLLYGEGYKVELMGIMATYEGIVVKFVKNNINTQKESSEKNKEKLEKLTIQVPCDLCGGKRFNEQVLKSKFQGYNIYDFTNMQLDELLNVLKNLKATKEEERVLEQLIKKVNDLVEIGLGYLSLSRETGSLSGGESQRVKMVKYLSSSLVDMIYILDEPSTGLHPKDVYRLNGLLRKIRDKGNTVLVVEHDPDVIKIGDHIVDVGPGAGRHGGEIMYTGDYEGLLKSKTKTGEYLSVQVSLNNKPKEYHEFYESKKSSLNNLKNVSLKVPKGVFTAVCGVAGSGKSTLVTKVFKEEFENIVYVDQTPIHSNVRSTPLTYLGIVTNLRKLFAKENGVSDSLFSANSKGGCESCNGTGSIEINVSFMDPIVTQCEECSGNRFKKEVLQYKYKGLSIVEVMNLSVEEGVKFFDDKKILKALEQMNLVGLGYLTLGQSLNTLSGGECQRLKLALELTKAGNIYILDEPTTGLHKSDIENIFAIIDHLIELDNTVIVIEHNTDIIKRADYVIELGPDGGSKGGEIIHEGTIKEMLENPKSVTKEYL